MRLIQNLLHGEEFNDPPRAFVERREMRFVRLNWEALESTLTEMSAAAGVVRRVLDR